MSPQQDVERDIVNEGLRVLLLAESRQLVLRGSGDYLVWVSIALDRFHVGVLASIRIVPLCGDIGFFVLREHG